ncbi:MULTISPECIES: hypothetical protein [Streptomyces]|uniref:hypothetical protein n=1 Tax=Streptomyces TaxID=1883 RepID=UPI001CEF6912|nr:hypothetical protein [Streptomyces griseus]
MIHQAQRPNPEFTTVFDGPLRLPDGRIAVGDVEQQTRFVHRVGDRGQFKVRVAVNTPGQMSTLSTSLSRVNDPRDAHPSMRPLNARRPHRDQDLQLEY